MELVAIHPQDGSQQIQHDLCVLQIQGAAVGATGRLSEETADDGSGFVLLIWE